MLQATVDRLCRAVAGAGSVDGGQACRCCLNTDPVASLGHQASGLADAAGEHRMVWLELLSDDSQTEIVSAADCGSTPTAMSPY